MPAERRVVSLLLPIVIIGLLASCGGDSKPPAGPSATTTPTSATPPPPTPSPTALATATPTPAPSCSVSITDARFDPARILCPAGTSTLTVRLVFEVSAGSLPVTINRVSSSGVTCRFNGGTCTWAEGSLSFSPSVVAAGTTVQVATSERFTCGGSPGGGASQGELIYKALFVNTSCGAAREIKVTNTLSLG